MSEELKSLFLERHEDDIEHFGIKGMKWGVWNDETRARRLGLGGKREVKLSKKEVETKAHEVADKATPIAKAAAKASEPYYKEYMADRDHWASVVTDYRNNKYGGNLVSSSRDKEDYKDFLLYDDGDQGGDNTFSMYLHCTGQTEKFNKEVVSKKDDYYNELNLSSKESVHGIRDDSSYEEYSKKYDRAERNSAFDVRMKADDIAKASLTDEEKKWLSVSYEHKSSQGLETEKINDEYLKGVDTKPKAKHSDETGTTFDLTKDEVLEHFGVKGMHWGVWNAETAARHRRAVKSAAKKAGNVIATHASKRKAAIGKAVVAKRTAKKEEAEKKREQKRFDKETRKKYGLSAKKYKKLREKTLNTYDPEKLIKGMHLLTDEELKAKVDRVALEDKLRSSANTKAKDRAATKQAKAEAFSKSPAGKLTNIAITKVGTEVLGGAAKALTNEGVTPYVEAVAKRYAKKGVDAIEAKNVKDEQAHQRNIAEANSEAKSKTSEARIAGIEANNTMKRLEALDDLYNESYNARTAAEAQHYKEVADAGAARVEELRKKAG